MPNPSRRCLGIAEIRANLGKVRRRVRLEQPLLLEPHHRGRGEAPDRVAALAALGKEAGRDHPGRVALPDNLDVGVVGLESLLQLADEVGLERRIHNELRPLGRSRERARKQDAESGKPAGQAEPAHVEPHSCRGRRASR
jgi:hypothetical protein